MATGHDLPLVSTIAVGLTLAFLFGLAASRLRIPPIVGYLLAGIMIGPHTPGFVGDMKIAEELSEIGIVLLMFGVGLHFSVKDLLEVRKIALPGAVVQMAAATVMGAALAVYAWDWTVEAGLMFGLALSVASTVVLLRSLEEHNLLQSTHGRIAIGWLIVEDLAMVFALVLIPVLGGADDAHPSFAVRHFFEALGKVALFVAVMFYGGKRFLPWILGMVARTRSRELFTLAVFAAAVGVAYGAAVLFDVSFALGAFFAGMMIRESDMNHEVADRALPFQDAFAVLFFVSVGMLFYPGVLIERPLDVLAVVGIIMVGKTLAALAIVLLFRYTLKTGLIVSSGLAQIGEFSFVLVALGITHGLLPPEGRDLVLAGALISIALNPLTFYASQKIYQYAGRNPGLKGVFNIEDDNLSHLRKGEKASLKDLVILVGFGKMGRHIAENIAEAHIDLVVIDSNRERVDALRDQGYHAIAGDGSHPETLKEAAINKAVALIVTTPDPFEARRIVEAARHINPDIKVAVHAHNDDELAYFMEQKVDLPLAGPQEIARRMVEYLHDIRGKKKK